MNFLLDTPCGQLPILSYGGYELAQSMTIARFLAREFNLSGKTFLDEAKADMIVDLVTDLLNSVVEALLKEKDETRKAMLIKKNKTEILPKGLEMLEKILADNGGQFFVGSSLTWADIVVADFLQGWVKDVAVPRNLKNHLNFVMNLPNIRKWVETRPKSNI